MFTLELSGNSLALYLSKRFEKNIEVIKDAKVLQFDGDWNEGEACLNTQYWLKQSVKM